MNKIKYLPGFVVLMSHANHSLSVFISSDMKLIFKIDSNVLKAEAKLVTGGIELQILKVRKILNLEWRVIDTVQIIGDNLLELRSRYIYD